MTAADYTFRHTDPLNGEFVVKAYTANGPKTPADPLNLYTDALANIYAVSADTSLALLGKGVVNYNVVQQNLLYLMENFASPTRPMYPSQGQVWYKNAAGVDANYPTDPSSVGLYLWNGTDWDSILINAGFSGDVDFGGFRGINVGDAINPTDALNMQTGDSRYVNVSGDTMTGALILNADPTVALGAATRQYVDAVSLLVSGKVDRTGDTMTGALILNADPTVALGAATKQYVDTAVGGVTVGSLADVVLTAVADGDVLTYDLLSSTWINAPAGGAAADGVVYAGDVNPLDGTLTLHRTIGLPDVTIVGLSPASHIHNSTDIPFDHTVAYPQSTLYGMAWGTPNYPEESINSIITTFDQVATDVLRPIHRQIVVGDGVTTNLPLNFDMEYTVGTNKIQIFKAGLKQYCNVRGRQTVSLGEDPPAMPPTLATDTGLTPSTAYTFNITVDGVGPTLVTITTPATTPYTILELLFDIDAELTTLTLPVSVNVEQYTSRIDFHFDSQTSGTGSTIAVADTGVNPLFGSIVDVIPTFRTAVAGVTYDYAEVGNPDDDSTDILFNAAMTLGSVYEILVTT